MAESTIDKDPSVSVLSQAPPEEVTTPIPSTSTGISTTDLLGAASASLGEFPSSSFAKEYGFDDDSVKAYDFELYKGRKGQTDRIALLTTPIGARTHFSKINNLGYFICNSVFKLVIGPDQKKMEIPENLAICCQKCDAPRKRFIAPLIKYTTTPDGKPTSQLGFSLMAWKYTDDKFITLRALDSEFPLNSHDILVTCTEEQYQRLTIQACAQSLVRLEKFPKELKDQIDLWVKMNRPKMAKTLGRKYSDQELMEKFGLAAPSSGGVAAGMDTPIMDIKSLLD